MKYLPYILIAIILFVAAGLYIDGASKNGTGLLPTINNTQKSAGAKLKNLGPAPELTGISKWLNSDPLTLQRLRGKVVLIDFWTYSCINCIRTLPYVTGWYEKYKADGFVVIGVHTPEFEFEKVTANVETAIKRYNITYPVAQDNGYSTWNAYSNNFWPAEYLIDKEGNIRYTHFGEGNYDHTENAIRQLLGLDGGADVKNPAIGNVGSPEMYFGTSRLEYLASEQKPSLSPKPYTPPPSLKLNTFALEGDWKFTPEMAQLTEPGGKIVLRFSSGKVHMVAESSKLITLKIFVDGKPQSDVTVGMSDLYTLFSSDDYQEHTIEIQIPEAGFNAFTFTFG